MKRQPAKPDGSSTFVQEMIRVTQWDNSHTNALEEFNMLTVHSLLIDSDPEFRELKAAVDNYNNSLREALNQKQPVNHASFRSKFTASLYKMLCEICQMKNSETQKKCLSEVYRWARDYEFEKKERPVTATTRASRPTTARTRPVSGASLVVPPGMNAARFRYDRNSALQLEELNRELGDFDYEPLFDGTKSRNSTTKNPLDKLKGNSEVLAENADYRQKSRTMHAELEPPSKRLVNYKRKCIDLVMETAPTATKERTKAVEQKPKPEVVPKKEPVAEVKEPEIPPPQIEQPPAEGEQPLAADGAVGQQAAAEEEDAAGMGGDDDIPLGEGEEELEAEAEPEEVVDKLAPRTKPYVQNYAAIEHTSLLAEQNRAVENHNKRLDEFRQEQQMIRVGVQWARSKSRWEQEEMRRRESAKVDVRRQRIQSAMSRTGNNPDVVDLSMPANILAVDAQPPAKIHHYEDTINRTVTDRIKSANISNIGYLHSRNFEEVAPAADINAGAKLKQRALSAKAGSVSQPKRFTDILLAAQDKIQSELDQEILEIKQRLAKNKVACGLDRLQAALCYDQPALISDGAMLITGTQLPSNPHFKVAKKKKKKKK